MFENSPSTTTRMLSPLRCGLGDASGDATAQALTITNVQARVALRSRDIDIDITLVGTAGVDRDRVGSCHRQRLRRQIETGCGRHRGRHDRAVRSKQPDSEMALGRPSRIFVLDSLRKY